MNSPKLDGYLLWGLSLPTARLYTHLAMRLPVAGFLVVLLL
jgi:hypothetical protein